jgi:type II secretory pathway pseudopilin PulG
MTRSPPERRRRGFTVGEITVVLMVISIFTASLIPGYMRYVYRARRAEAIIALRAIHDAQLVYHKDHEGYADSFEKLGVPIESATLRNDGSVQGTYYTYTLTTWEMFGVADANYRATATGNIDPRDSILDIVIVENQLTVKD